jgi:hypothetical protein
MNFINRENREKSNFMKCLVFTIVFAVIGVSNSYAQNSVSKNNETTVENKARVIGLKNICVHVLELEKTLKLYREILGFKLNGAEVYKAKGIEGMLVMKLKAGDLEIHLSLTAPEYMHTIGPIGNTNHNHFMLRVNDIKTIGDKLVEEGYELENENYARDKYTFFVGPNGEIIGLSAW